MAVLLVWGGILLAQKVIEIMDEQNQRTARATALVAESRRQRYNQEWQLTQPRRLDDDEPLSLVGPAAPSEYVCPISLDVMKDPVVIETGMTFDRESIVHWFATGRKSCPLTNQPLTTTAYCANTRLKQEISDWRKQAVKRLQEEPLEELVAKAALLRRKSGSFSDRKLQRSSSSDLRSAAQALDIDLEDVSSERMLTNMVSLLPSNIVGSTAAELLEYVADQDDTDKLRIAAVGGLTTVQEVLDNTTTDESKINALRVLDSLASHPTLKPRLINSGVHMSLVQLLNEKDAIIQTKAGGCLKSIVQNASATVLLNMTTSLPPLLKISRNPEHPSRAIAVEILAFMAMNDELANELFEQGFIDLLISIMATAARRCVEKAVFGVFCLSMHTALVPALVEGGALNHVVQQLSKGTTNTQACAAGAVMYISCHRENRMLVVASGAVPPLIQLLTSSRRCQAFAAGALSCVHVEGNVANKGAVGPLVRMMERGEDPWCQEMATHALSVIVKHSISAQRKFLDAGGMTPVVRLLLNPRASGCSQLCAVEIVMVMAAFKAVRDGLLFSPDVMEKLREISRSPNEEAAAAAQSALATLTMDLILF